MVRYGTSQRRGAGAGFKPALKGCIPPKLQRYPDSPSGVDKTACKLSKALDEARGQLSASDCRALAEALDLPPTSLGAAEEGNTGSGYLVGQSALPPGGL